MPENTAITSTAYFHQLQFAYFDTYSFCRGEQYQSESLPVEFLTDANKSIHPSAVLYQTARQDSSFADALKQALMQDIHMEGGWMCGPVYRDGIIFYNEQGEIISVLNVCLSCCHMQLDDKTYLSADFLTYDLLKKLFLEAGHPVEEPEHFYVPGLKKHYPQ